MPELRKALAAERGCSSRCCWDRLRAFQRPFREYPGIEYNDFPLPADAQEKTDLPLRD